MAAPLHPTLLAPSLLAGDHANLASSAATIRQHGLSWAHFDVMDGHFVPNLTFGPQTLQAVRQHVPELHYDVHLMLSNPQEHIDAFLDAGAGHVSIHVEPDYPIAETLAAIRAAGAKCGIVANPGTPVEALEPYLEAVDLVLVMTVQPGYGGQAFRNDMLPKINHLAKRRSELGLNYRLEVDGGVDLKTGPLCREAGADTLVAGTAFFKAADPSAFARKLIA